MASRFQPAQIRELSAVEAAWLGAMVDGEGSIVLRKLTNGSEQVIVQVCNSNVEIISTCLRLAGEGCIYLRTMTRQPEHWLPVWFWIITRQKSVQKLLLQILPYLAGKREKAEHALAFLSAKLAEGGG